MVDSDNQSHVETALSRCDHAIELANDDKLRKASEEWRKVFGDQFPLAEDPEPDAKKTLVFAPRVIERKKVQKPWSR